MLLDTVLIQPPIKIPNLFLYEHFYNIKTQKLSNFLATKIVWSFDVYVYL